MPTANIEINGVAASNDALPINTIVQLTNDDTGGEVTYFWEILDQPDGPADSLSASSVPNPTFTPKKEGAYFIRLTVNAGTSPIVGTRVAAVRQVRTNARLPSAFETLEVDATKGWKTAANQILRRVDSASVDANLVTVVCAASNTPAIGSVVALTGTTTIKTGLPGQEDVLVAERALASSAALVAGPVGILISTPTGSPAAAGSVATVRQFGLVELIGTGTPAVGDPVYVSDAGSPALTRGTNMRAIGRVTSQSGPSYRLAIDGSYFAQAGAATLPVSVKDHGAAGDYNLTTGSGTDDRTAFVNAIAFAVATGNDVRIPPGTYKISKYVPITGAVNTKILASAFATVVYASDDTSTIADATAISNNMARSAFLLRRCQNVTIDGLNFVGGGTAEISSVNVGSGIYATRCTKTQVLNCSQRSGYSLFAQDATADTTSGTGNALAVSGGIVTLTNNGDPNVAFHAGMVGRGIVIAGATNEVNNTSGRVLSVISSTQLTYAHPPAVAESGGVLTYRVDDGDKETMIDGCTLFGCRGVLYTGSNSVVRSCTFRQPMTYDRAGIPIGFVVSGGNVTMTAFGEITQELVGRYVKVDGATSSGNNLTAKITAVTTTTGTTPGSITYANGSGVTELAPEGAATFLVPGGEKSGLGAGSGSISSSSGVVTFTSAAAMFAAGDVRKVLRFIDVANAGNRGSFVITRYISSTQVQFVNVLAVNESFAGVVTVDGYDSRKGDANVGGPIDSTSTSVASLQLTDGTLSMVAHAYAGRYLTDSAFKQWEIADNTSTVFTLLGSGTPSAGSYTVTAASTHGSTHAIYLFGGRQNVKVDGCWFFGIRTTCVKASGSSAPMRDIRVRGCTAVECGSFAVLGADDAQVHESLTVQSNSLMNCAVGRVGWNDQWGIGVLGASGVQITDNQIRVTHDNVYALVDSGSVGGFYGIFAARYRRGASQPLENLSCSRNMIGVDGHACRPDRVAASAIHVERVGQFAKWATASGMVPFTVALAGGIVTLTDPLGSFVSGDIGSSLETVFFSDAGNNVSATVLSVPSSTSITFANGSAVAGSKTAGTYRMKPRALNNVKRGSSCMIIENQITGYGSVGIDTVACVGPEVVRNVFSSMIGAISDDGSVGPRIVGNREIVAASNAARIKLTSYTSWPHIDDNVVTNGALSGQNLAADGVLAATRSDMGISVDSTVAIDYPLGGKRGRCKSTNAHAELVFAFGRDWVDGDRIEINGSTYTYKESAPAGVFQFNGMVYGAGSNVNENQTTITKGLTDGDAGATTTGATRSGFTAEDYGTGLSGTPTTGHVRVKTTATTASVHLGFVDQFNILNPTACVAMRNDLGGGESVLETVGEGDAGPIAVRLVIWSPAAQLSAGVMLAADNAAGATLLAGGYYAEKSAGNSGCCEVIKTLLPHAGTEEVRWVIT